MIIEINDETMLASIEVKRSNAPAFADEIVERITFTFSPEKAYELAEYIIEQNISRASKDAADELEQVASDLVNV